MVYDLCCVFLLQSVAMEALYHSTNRALQDVQAGFVHCERQQGGAGDVSGTLRELQRRLDQITANCDRLDVLVQKEPAQRRQGARARVEQLKQDVRHLRAALGGLAAGAAQRRREEAGREELLKMRFTTNAAAHSLEGNSSETSILIDRALEHNAALDRSHRGLDDLLAQGGSMLESLRDQRGSLKGIQKKMLDVASTLGMSSTVMRLIERRQEGDKWILFGGMAATCLVMYLVVRFWA